MWHVASEGSLTREEEEGGGRSRLVSLEMHHVANEDLLSRGEKEGEERSTLVSSEHGMLQMRAHSLEGRKREEGGAG
jgi:hypothetical protein